MMTDFHSHILPGIDDGSSSVEESLEMLRMEASQGIRRVVATPHFYARYESVDAFLEKRCQAENELRAEMAQAHGLPELYVGAEVYYFRGISECDFLPSLAIQGTNCILIEMPPAPWQDSMYRELDQICRKTGLTPVIAHVDRYIAPFHTYGIPKHLESLPVLVQANASFFQEHWTKHLAVKMLKAGQIHLLGSDCHNLDSRKPNLGDVYKRIEKKLGKDSFRLLSSFENLVFNP